MSARLDVRAETWPLAGQFAISRGSRTETQVVVVELHRDGAVGRGECVPYAHYGETVEGVIAAIEAQPADIERADLAHALEAGAARNALDCALWDIEAKRTGTPVWQLAGLAEPKPVTTAFTLGLDDPEAMGRAAAANAWRPLIKLKLGGEGDFDRVAAVRANAPESNLIVDANEGWNPDMVAPYSAKLADLGVTMIEQPLPANADEALAELAHPEPICADEACHTSADLARLEGRYDMVNVKLDKTGGLSEAMALVADARTRGFGVMVGCMIGTSLAMAPGVLLAQGAEIVDLDGPLLLANDRDGGLHFEGSTIHPPAPTLWG